MNDPRDLSGIWYGSYAADHYDERNSFIAALDELAGVITGTITEPDKTSGAIRRATVSGLREEAALRFIKQYDGTCGWTHAVRYAGNIDGEATLIAGSWMVAGLTGSFMMEREKFKAEELEGEVEEEIVEPVTLG